MHLTLRSVVVAALIAGLLSWQLNLPLVVLAQATSPESERLERLFEALSRTVSTLPKDTFSVDEVLLATDLSPEDAFAWVRDNTRLVAYRGALRGPVGVLLDRRGNSLDRALLLQDMLDGLGYDTRLVSATLGGDELAAVAGAFTDPRAAAPVVAMSVITAPPPPQALAALADSEVAEVESLAERFVQQHQRLRGDLADRVEQQAPVLREVLDAAMGSTGTANQALLDSQLAALSEHWWVQYDDFGQWIDLDPTASDAAPGETLAAPTTTLDGLGFGALPSGSLHRLDIDVVVECAVDGSLITHTLLDVPGLIPAALIGETVILRFSSPTLSASGGGSLEALATDLLAHDAWFPIVTVGGDSSYELQVDANRCETAAPAVEMLGGSISRALGGALDAFGSLEPRVGDAVTAMWIDYRVHVPGESPTEVRRYLFDALGEAKRRAGTAERTADDAARESWRLRLLGETEILPTVAALSSDFVTNLTATAVLGQRSLLLAAEDADAGRQAALQESAGAAPRVPSGLYALALARQLGAPDAVFHDRVNVLSRHVWSTQDPTLGLLEHQSFDIVVNRLAAAPAAGDPTAEIGAQGVRDTNAEALVSRDVCELEAPSGYCRVEPNAADLLADPTADDWASVTDIAALDALALPWSDDALARLRTDLELGYVALVPTAAPAGDASHHWWLIDPTTGATLGVNEDGWGTSSVEYNMLILVIGLVYCLRGGGPSARTAVLCVAGWGFGLLAIASAGTLAMAAGILAAIALGEGGLGGG